MDGIKRRLTLFGTSVAVALAVVVSARATAPASESFAVTVLDAMPCAGFSANIERNFTGRATAYFDQHGDVSRVQVLAEMRGSVTNSVTGKTLALRGQVLQVIDVADGATTFVGPVFIGNSPGAGSVIKDTGRIVFGADGGIAFEAGPHDAVDSSGDVFCQAVG